MAFNYLAAYVEHKHFFIDSRLLIFFAILLKVLISTNHRYYTPTICEPLVTDLTPIILELQLETMPESNDFAGLYTGYYVCQTVELIAFGCMLYIVSLSLIFLYQTDVNNTNAVQADYYNNNRIVNPFKYLRQQSVFNQLLKKIKTSFFKKKKSQ
jgi:hypothetical protein